jgi:DNA-binding MarR family transcriptional regulator
MQHKTTATDLAKNMALECVGTRVGRLHRVVSRRFDESLRPLGLTIPQIEILSALSLIGQSTKPSTLADKLSMERSTMSRNLAIMEDRGWVTAGEKSATGRSMSIVITDQGAEKLVSANDAWNEAQKALVQTMGPETARVIDAWLGELTR